MRFAASVGGTNRHGGRAGHEVTVRVESLPATESVSLALRMLARQLEDLATNVDQRIAEREED